MYKTFFLDDNTWWCENEHKMKYIKNNNIKEINILNDNHDDDTHDMLCIHTQIKKNYSNNNAYKKKYNKI